MNEICIFAGTTEGRALTQLLTENGIPVYACVATEYGEALLEPNANLTISSGRLTQEQMEGLFREKQFECVVDATHPYASVVTENLAASCAASGTEYLRLLREESELPQGCVYAENAKEAAQLLEKLPGNILLTTGSKELAVFSSLPDFAERVYARVLPLSDSLRACEEAGLPKSHVFAIQGPFSLEMNLAMLRFCNASVLVTKEAGSKGGFPEKAEAAREAGVRLVVIGRPTQKKGMAFGEIAALFASRYGFRLRPRVSLVGIGSGDPGRCTLDAHRVIQEADCLIGAERMLEAVGKTAQLRIAAIRPEEIRAAILHHPECRSFAVLLSGDVGFFSGAKKLLPMLSDFDTESYPGLSSLSVLCSRLGVGYEDAVTVSLHGRDCAIASIVARQPKVFVLLGGENGAGRLCRHLCEFGLGDVNVAVGQQLGYPEEQIIRGTARELADREFHSLSAALITHEAAPAGFLKDEDFRRSRRSDGRPVPMTKRDIRIGALARLELQRDSICWDIGAGTGSVSIEMARQCPYGRVYAVEKQPEALELLEENRKAHHADNITLIPGTAPDNCRELPVPSHVFIGGSSGNLRGIIGLALEKNPGVRLVVSAIALETVSELEACRKLFRYSEVTCLTAAQGQKVGDYTLLQGQNPVYLFTMWNR